MGHEMSKPPESVGPRFGKQPRGGRHLYAVARFDSGGLTADPAAAFTLTRGFWDEKDAEEHAQRPNAAVERTETRYFVLPVRVHDDEPAKGRLNEPDDANSSWKCGWKCEGVGARSCAAIFSESQIAECTTARPGTDTPHAMGM